MPANTVAIIGRPNVGKSTLFNRIIRKKKAIVDSVEGITRDRLIETTDWNGRRFDLIDTGGFIPGAVDTISQAVCEQVKIAAEESDVVIFLVDGRTGITHFDDEVSKIIKSTGKACVVAVNKMDNENYDTEAYQFFSLGLGEPVPISALNGRNIGDLLDKVTEQFPAGKEQQAEGKGIRFTVLGMPNVGKSSLVNAILGKEKAIVTDIPGTTRDSVDSTFTYYGRKYIIVDTAGLRKQSRIKDKIEFYSTVRTLRSLQHADVAVVVIDAHKGFGHHDKEIIKTVIEMKKGMIISVNKWDLIEKETNTMKEFQDELLRLYPELRNYPLIFTSAKTKRRVFKLVEAVREVHKRRQMRIDTSDLNEYFQRIFRSVPPPAVKGKYIKINYVTQVRSAPPLFIFFSNFPELIVQNYRRFLERKLRERWNFMGVPLILSFRQK